MIGSDNIYSEIIKLMDVDNLELLLKLFNNIYKTGKIPQNNFRLFNRSYKKCEASTI